jgi:hypothetical protein
MAKKPAKANGKTSNWTWVQPARDKWVVSEIPEGENSAPRVTESSIDSKGERRYYCYRNGQYLGSHRTLDAAKERCWIGEMTRESEVFIEFQRTNPGIIPPGIGFTPADWHEWKRANPGGPGTGHQAAKVEKNEKKLALMAERVEKAGAELGNDKKIKRLKPDNPKKVGTGPHKRWEFMFSHVGKTVATYVANKGNTTTLENAIKQGYVELV